MMMSLFWKNRICPKKGQKGAKVGGAVGKNQLYIFDILHEVKGH